MTSSEKQTDISGKPGDSGAHGGGAGAMAAARARAGGGAPGAPLGGRTLSRMAAPITAVVLLVGCAGILYAHRWRFDAPVLFLVIGWLAIVLAVYYLWQAGLSAARDTGEADDDEFWRPTGKRDELMREKQALLKAIKEIEFDHQMGKTSQEDFDELSSFYRARAIEVIKALDESEARSLTVTERIEQEVKARLTVDRSSTKGQRAASSKRAAGKEAVQ